MSSKGFDYLVSGEAAVAGFEVLEAVEGFSRLALSTGTLGREGQGLTLVHFSAQLERFVWDRGYAEWLCNLCEGVVRGCSGCVGCFIVTDTAQVELRSGRVSAPGEGQFLPIRAVTTPQIYILKRRTTA